MASPNYAVYLNYIKEFGMMDQLLQLRPDSTHNDKTTAIIKFLRDGLQHSEPLTQNQTYRLLDRLSDRIRVSYPHLLITQNLVSKLKRQIRLRIQSEQQEHFTKKFKPNLKELFADMSLQHQHSSTTEHAKEDPRWVKMAALEEMDNLREDLAEVYEEIGKYLERHIKARTKVVVFEPDQEMVGLFEGVRGKVEYTATIIRTGEGHSKKSLFETILLKNSSRIVKQADIVVIPCHAILKNGAAVAKSGALLLAITAKSFSIPVVAMSSSHSLTNRFCFQPNSISCMENPLNHFPQSSQPTYGQTFILKKYDYLPPKHLALVVTDIGEATPSYMYKLFEKHYD